MSRRLFEPTETTYCVVETHVVFSHFSAAPSPAERLCAAVGGVKGGRLHNASRDSGNHGDVWF